MAHAVPLHPLQHQDSSNSSSSSDHDKSSHVHPHDADSSPSVSLGFGQLLQPLAHSATPPPVMMPHWHSEELAQRLYTLSRAEGPSRPSTPPPVSSTALHNYTMTKNFLLRLTKALYSFGLPAHRLSTLR